MSSPRCPTAAVLVIVAALAAGCSRDLSLPSTAPPTLTSYALLAGTEITAPTGQRLHVLGGQLVAIHGGGFPATRDQVQAWIGTAASEVLEAQVDRLVVRVPTLAAAGPADVTVTTPSGFRTATSALHYDGPGQPQGFGTSSVPTTFPLAGLSPAASAAASADPEFPDVVAAFGAADSALLVLADVGAAYATVPLGIVPSSIAARAVTSGLPATTTLDVLAVDADGVLVAAHATVDPARGWTILSRLPTQVGALPASPTACTAPRVLFPFGASSPGPAVVTWQDSGGSHVAAYDLSPSSAPAIRALSSSKLPSPILSWAARSGSGHVLLVTAGEVYEYDPSATYAGAPPPPWKPTGGQTLSQLLAAGCAAIGVDVFHAVATHGLDGTAVAFKQAGLNWIAQLGGAIAASAPLRGLTGLPVNALAFASGTAQTPGAGPLYVLAAAGSTVQRFEAAAGPVACGAPTTLGVTAAVQLDADPLAASPSFGGLLGAAGGGRALAVTPGADVVQVIPDTLTSLGPVLRFAAYAGVTTAQVGVPGVATESVAIVEHALLAPGAGAIDTGSAELLTSFDGAGIPLALGGSGYGHGAAWVATATQWALAYAGDLPATGALAAAPGGAAAVTAFKADRCQLGQARVSTVRAVAAGAPDLLVQGPARAGSFGPLGTTYFGPAGAPVYTARGSTLSVQDGTSATLSCLVGLASGAIDWSCLAGAPTIDLGATPIDVTFSAGDATAAVRSLSPACGACTAPFSCAGAGPAATCPAGDLLCGRAFCPVAASVSLARSGAAPTVVALPRPPAGISPDAAGGFLVTMACDPAAPAGSCFSTTLCAGLVTKGSASGALLWLPEDGSAPSCLAVLAAIAGPVAITPNGAEAWIAGVAATGQLTLTRLSLPRHAHDGTLDLEGAVKVVQRDVLGRPAAVAPGAPPSGIAFAADGSAALATVPGEFRTALIQ